MFNSVSYQLPILLGFVIVSLTSARGATLTVTTLNDNVSGSLRRAISDANNGDTIGFASNVRGTIVLTAGEISVPSPKDLTVIGPGATALAISGNNSGRILNVPGNLNISGLKFIHGIGGGGAIRGEGVGTITACIFEGHEGGDDNDGAALFLDSGVWSISSCSFSRNIVRDGSGGAIAANSQVTSLSLTRCTFSENEATEYGGAVAVAYSRTAYSETDCIYGQNRARWGGAVAFLDLTIFFTNAQNGSFQRSVFFNNSATEFGGAIFTTGHSDKVTTFRDSTCWGNSSQYGGAIFHGRGTLNIANCTIVQNAGGYFGSTPGAGGGIRIRNLDDGTVILKNTLIAFNSAPAGGPDVSGDFTSDGYNLVRNRDGGNGFGAIGDITGNTGSPVDPRLGAIGLYGGGTYTIPLLPGSPAIDQGKTADLTFDQRGKPRPIDFLYISNAVGGDGSDIGAFEVQAAPPYRTDFNLDAHADLLLFNPSSRQTAIWYLNSGQLVSTAYGPSLSGRPGYSIVGATDFNSDGKPDYMLYNPSTRKTEVWFMNNQTYSSLAYGTQPITTGYNPVAAIDVTGDGQGDLVFFNPTNRRTAFWYLNRGSFVGSRYGPSIPTGYDLVALGDFNRDGEPDYFLENRTTQVTAIWYIRNGAIASTAYGPRLGAGYTVVGVSDMNRDGNVDLILQHPSTRRLAYWFMSNNVRTGSAYGPTVPAGYVLAAP